MKTAECDRKSLKCVRLLIPTTFALFGTQFCSAQTDPFPVTIRVNASESMGELRHIWRFFGADEPNYATMKDGQKLLADFGALRPREVFFRAHNLLNSGDGTPALKWGSTDAYTEDEHGTPVYNWKILDRIFDSYLHRLWI